MMTIQKSLKVYWISILLVVGLMLIAGDDLLAEETAEADKPVKKLEDITVTGIRTEGEVKATGVEKIIDQEDLEIKQVTSTSDILKYVPSVDVTSREPGSSSRVTIRGLGRGARSVTLYDGIVMTDFTTSGNNVNWDQIAPEEIDNIEVVYGPFSALYSGNTMGGAVDITTKDPEKREMSLTAGYGFQNYSMYNYSETLPYSKINVTYGDRIGRFHVFGLLNRFDVDVQPYTYSTKTESSTSSGTGQQATGWDVDTDPLTGEKRYIFGDQGERERLKYMGKLRVGFDLNEFTTISADYRHWTEDEDLYHSDTYLRDSQGNPIWSGRVEVDGQTYNPSYSGARESEAAGDVYQLTFKREPEEGLKTRVTAAYVDNYKDQTLSSSGTMPEARDGGEGKVSDTSTGWYNVDWLSSLTVMKQHEIAGGFHYDQYFTDSETWKLSDWKDEGSKTEFSDGSEGKTQCYALFLQDEWTITDKYALYVGGRYEWWKGYDASLSGGDSNGNIITQDIEARNEDYFSPKLAFTYRPNPKWRLRLSLAQAYRFPTTAELFYGSIDASTGYTTKTNPDLKTEKTFAKDISITRTIDGGSIRLSLFENDVDDYICLQTNIDTQVNYYQNIEKVRIRGVEFDISKRFNRYFKSGFNVTFLDPKIRENSGYPDSEGKIVPSVAQWIGNLTLEFTPMEKLSVLLGGRYRSTAYSELDNSDIREDGYGGYNGSLILDTKVAYQFNRNWRVSLAVDNITDEEVFWYHPYNQRMYSFELKWVY